MTEPQSIFPVSESTLIGTVITGLGTILTQHDSFQLDCKDPVSKSSHISGY